MNLLVFNKSYDLTSFLADFYFYGLMKFRTSKDVSNSFSYRIKELHI